MKIFFNRWLVLAACFFLVESAIAQIRGTEITVVVAPDHADWNYETGEKARFTAKVLRAGVPMRNVEVDYEAGPEMYASVKRHATLEDGTMTWTGTMPTPGFYRLKVTAHVGGRDYSGWCTAAFSPQRIKAKATMPADFTAFWDGVMAEARQTPLQPTVTLLPERCTEDVNVYHVSFQNIRPGSRTYGILCVPVKSGTYPALLRVPGAGIRPYEGDRWMASLGCITLEIGIHGIPVTMTQDYYDKLFYGALNGYWEMNTDDRDGNYYKRVFVGALRAIDYIATLPQWDGRRLCVTGSSQGGMLSLVCAALDKRVTCYGAVHAAMCDHEAALSGQPCGWPHYFYGKKDVDKKAVEAARYYDGVNFARLINCPGWFSFGYNDDVVPPTSAYATYNEVTAPKTLRVFQQTAHFWYQEQWDEWNEWIREQFRE